MVFQENCFRPHAGAASVHLRDGHSREGHFELSASLFHRECQISCWICPALHIPPALGRQARRAWDHCYENEERQVGERGQGDTALQKSDTGVQGEAVGYQTWQRQRQRQQVIDLLSQKYKVNVLSAPLKHFVTHGKEY